MPFEQGLDNGCTGRRATNAVFFQGIPQFIVIHQFSGSFHGTQQGGFGIGTRRLCPFLVEHRAMRTAFSFGESGQYAFFLVFLPFFRNVLSKDYAPAGFQNLLSGHLELYLVCFTDDGRGRKLTIRIEHSDEAAGNQVEHPFFHVAEALRLYPGRDDSMVVGHLAVIEYFFRFNQWFSA